MKQNLMELIRERFRLETSLLRLELQEKAAEQTLRQAKYDLRQAEQEQVLYSGSLRAIRDRLTGKREERELSLDRAVRQAQGSLSAAQQEKARIDGAASEVRAELDRLPALTELEKEAEGNALVEFRQRESLLTLERLMPQLEEILQGLEELREIQRGQRIGELKTREEWIGIRTIPERQAEALRPMLSKLEAQLPRLGLEFSTGEFFSNPTVFLNPAASHNRPERTGKALAQTERMHKEFLKIREKLTSDLH